MVHPMYTAASHLVRAHGNAFVHFLVCLWSPPPPSQLNIIILAAPSIGLVSPLFLVIPSNRTLFSISAPYSVVPPSKYHNHATKYRPPLNSGPC